MSFEGPTSSQARTGAALSVDGIRVSLGGHEVLCGVELRIEPGTVLGVLGPSGAGKTTLFRVIVGELTPGAGRVRLGDHDVTDLPLYRRARLGVGYLPQTPSILFDLDVRSNVRTFERALGLAARSIQDWTLPLGLSDRLDVRASELSGGEQRRLGLLRTLMAEPSVLVLDEPFSGVDPARAADIGRLLRQRAAQGVAVVVADHRIREVLEFCDQAALLVGGRVEVVAASTDFADHDAVVRRYVG